jgi:hypothetical protein
MSKIMINKKMIIDNDLCLKDLIKRNIEIR